MKIRMRSEEGDDELPFAFMLITLMASCGLSPYESFKRLRFIEILPFIQKESEEIVKQVEVLNRDPLTAMLRRAEETKSRAYGDFLRGYISTVESGGGVTSYLKSKLRSIFEIRAAAAARSIERLETLVEAYMVMLLVLLCVYILGAVMSSAAFSSSLGMSFGSSTLVYIILFVVMPSISLIFMLFAHFIRRGTLMNINAIYYRALPSAVISAMLLSSFVLVPEVQTIVASLISALQTTLNNLIPIVPTKNLSANLISIFVTGCLVFVSLPPMISYRRMISLNMKAEEAIPSLLQDISESRKTGMSPEKSIVHGVERKGYGSFSKILKRIADQIEWGISLRKIFEDLRDRIRSWPVLINFLILIETIEVGGGSPEALEMLASYSEKIRDVEKNKRDMLKPYVILPFIWTILMALTFTFTFYVFTQLPIWYLGESSFPLLESQMTIFSSVIIFHSWLSGFFIGKVTQGTFAAGFEYSILLAIVSLASLLLSQNLISIFFGVLF